MGFPPSTDPCDPRDHYPFREAMSRSPVSRVSPFSGPRWGSRGQDYLSAVDGIIFLVDAADRTRFQEATGLGGSSGDAKPCKAHFESPQLHKV